MHIDETYHTMHDIEIEDVEFVDGELFFFSKKNNSFCKKGKNGEVIRIASIPNEPLDGYRLYASMEYWNRHIYLIPFSANSIVIYNIDDGTMKFISLSKELMSSSFRFRACKLINKKLYLFSLYTASIYSLDLISNTFFMEANIDKSLIGEAIFDKNEIFFSQQVAVLGNKIYAPLANANGLVVFDINTRDSEFIQLDKEARGYSGIAIKDNDLFLGARGKNGKCAIWNINDRNLEYLDIDVRDVSGVYLMMDKPVYLSAWDYSFVKMIDDKIFMFDVRKKHLIYKQGNNESIISTRIKLFNRDLHEYVHHGSTLNEGQLISLEEFLIGVL